MFVLTGMGVVQSYVVHVHGARNIAISSRHIHVNAVWKTRLRMFVMDVKSIYTIDVVIGINIFMEHLLHTDSTKGFCQNQDKEPTVLKMRWQRSRISVNR